MTFQINIRISTADLATRRDAIATLGDYYTCETEAHASIADASTEALVGWAETVVRVDAEGIEGARAERLTDAAETAVIDSAS